jgi:hypothetical protein
VLEQAASVLTSRIANTIWDRVDTSQTGGSYELAFFNPSTLQQTWNSNVVIPANQIAIYVGATDFRASSWSLLQDSTGDGATQLMSFRNATGGVSTTLCNASQLRPIDASITFDLAGVQGFSGPITRQWFFGATDTRDPADPHYYDYTDFYGTAIHEIGHVLGITNPDMIRLIAGSDYDPGFELAYISQVQPDGSGGYVFTGTNASQHYNGHVGQPIPLENATLCHWADGVRSDTSDGWTSLTYEDGQPFRVTFSELEFGALQDIGYTVSPVVPEPASLSLVLLGGALARLLRRRAHSQKTPI